MKGRTIKVAIVDFSDFFNEELILKFLKPDFSPIIDNNNPDFVFYSTFGIKHLEYKNAIKILINVESFIPDFNDCDYAISTIKQELLGRTLWIPASFWFMKGITLNAPEITKEIALNRKFCVFLYSQDYYGDGASLRKHFCQELMNKYKKVECPGNILRNVYAKELSDRSSHDWIDSKRKYFSNFKFCIAFENMDLPGYITEKLVDCYLSNTVPIYWGSSKELVPFPKESIICAHDFSSLDALIDYIKIIDQDENLYMSILNANPFKNNTINNFFENELRAFMAHIITNGSHLFKNVHPLSTAQRCQQLNTTINKIYLKLKKILKKIIFPN
ncbi:MAG: hypothetical protein IJB33_02185 [Akkermansia sp.]|nr:hypothetical protein [Akkermansia sp.]